MHAPPFFIPLNKAQDLPGGALHIFWVRRRAIGKGIYFQDIGIKNGINFHNFGIRNGTDLQDFAMKYKFRYTFLKNWYTLGAESFAGRKFCEKRISRN